jgi:MatE
MNDQSIASSLRTFSPTKDKPAARPMAARTKLLLEGPILPTLLRLAAPNVLNLLAIAGMITFDGLFLGRLGPDVLAGVSLAFPFVMLIQHTAASGMGGAVSSLSPVRSVPVSATSPTPSRSMRLFWRSGLPRPFRRCCCSPRPSFSNGWADMAKCWLLPLPTGA